MIEKETKGGKSNRDVWGGAETEMTETEVGVLVGLREVEEKRS